MEQSSPCLPCWERGVTVSIVSKTSLIKHPWKVFYVFFCLFKNRKIVTPLVPSTEIRLIYGNITIKIHERASYIWGSSQNNPSQLEKYSLLFLTRSCWIRNEIPATKVIDTVTVCRAIARRTHGRWDTDFSSPGPGRRSVCRSPTTRLSHDE